ncbi:DNA-3-methyladenine glycosylase II [Paenibacillus castaneae]|uniref:DNA-3-methyladenine glycosylase family protein n=1 Tax=Paenibacillus castaneae TaxID=474957 RepID=UPI000C9CD4FB|nr:DNA-3-methyladenine glycosylase [Paenibacillus castaneae]NIK79994.1 DNA-3-methyladenine glycosylase II [Paenibacillus castaneae]
MEIEIPVRGAFSFAENMGYLTRSTNECMYQIDNHKITKLIPLQGEHVLLEISSNDSNKSLLITCMASSMTLNEQHRASIINYVEDWFDLERDLTPFYDMAQNDPLLREVVKRFYGLRILGISDLFEALCWGIMGQQINLTFAYTLKRRFVEAYGKHIEWNGQNHYLFPEPQQIAALTVEDLRALQLTNKKSEYLIGVAQLIADGRLTKEQLLAAGDCKSAEKQLVQIRGIGPWTANYVLMRCLRHSSAFPIDDVGLHLAIKHLLDSDRKPTISEIRQLSANWSDWEAYATFYLWRCLY